MYELWIRVLSDSKPQFVTHCVASPPDSSYRTTFVFSHEHSGKLIRGGFYEALLLKMKPRGGRLLFEDTRVIGSIRHPVFARVSHVDPRECQAFPIGSVDLIGLVRFQEQETVAVRRTVVLPRGPFKE